MSRFHSEVGKVGRRLGRLKAAPILGVPNLPNLPNLFSTYMRARERRCGRTCAYARTGNYFHVGKVRKVGKIQQPCGLQPSQPLPNLGEVGK